MMNLARPRTFATGRIEPSSGREHKNTPKQGNVKKYVFTDEIGNTNRIFYHVGKSNF